MSDNIVKIRLKFGQSEIDYEGPLSFLQNDFSVFMKEMADFCKNHSIAMDIDLPASSEKALEQISNENKKINLSTESIASRLQVKTGPELALAASIRLNLVKGKEEFSRQDILDEMRSAKAYYKKSMGSNMISYVAGLVKNQSLNEISSGIYALNAGKKVEMEKKLLD